MVDNQTQVAMMKPGSGSWSVLTSDRTRGGASSISWTLDGTRVLLTRTPAGALIVLRINEERLPQLFRHRRSSQAFDPLDAILPTQWANARVTPDGTTPVCD